MMSMSKESYIERYAATQGVSIEDVEKHLLPVRCDCDDPRCIGWSMTNVGDAVVIGIEKARHYVMALRRVLNSQKPARSIGMVDGAILSDLLGQLEMQCAPHEPVTLQPIGIVNGEGEAK